jgi:signal transduction histidine kinase
LSATLWKVEEEYSVLARTYFHTVAHHIHELLGCEAVLLALHCPEAEAGHPLLQWLPDDETACLYGATELLALFEEEQVRALRDIACQRGQMRFINERCMGVNGLVAWNVAIAPLVYPVGLAGYLVLASAFAGGFTPGDIRLLDGYLPAILPAFESNMRALCGIEHSSASGKQADKHRVSTQVEREDTSGAVDSMKNDLISMVSHELRAPLTAIKGYAGLLQAYSLEDRQQANEPGATITPARQQRYLDIIMDQAAHLELLMGDLLDVSRIQAGKLALRFTEVDVASLCQQVMRLVQQRIDRSDRDRYVLRCEVSPELPPLQADANRLHQILHNLLDNAIKYSPNGGVIELHASMEYVPLATSSFHQQRATRPVTQITIRDQGIGISAQQRARLFQPFSRLDHPLTSRVQGAGLGLYITHRLVEAMQGTMELTSQEDKGTCITLRFPLHLSLFSMVAASGAREVAEELS